MSLKLIAVRIPESMHTYIKVKAAAKGTTVQQITNEMFADYQSRDVEYRKQMDNSVTQALNGLARFTEQEVAHGV